LYFEVSVTQEQLSNNTAVFSHVAINFNLHKMGNVCETRNL